MKTRLLSLILALTLLLPCLAACDSAELPSSADGMTSVKPEQSSEDEESPAGTEPDYSCFDMPEATDTLVLYQGDLLQKDTYPKAIAVFEKMYPDVNVVVECYSEDEYDTAIRAEIPAGRGPDLLFAGVSVLPDICKTMETGLFEDLNPYAETDPDFSLDDYIAGVMDAGVLHGSRWIMPYSHLAMILTTTEELLEEEGITQEDFSSIEAFCAVCAKYRETHPGQHFVDLGFGVSEEQQRVNMFKDLYTYSGMRFFDYETGEVVVDRDELKRICDLCRMYCHNPVTKETKKITRGGNSGMWDPLLDRATLFFESPNVGITFMMLRYTLGKKGETPVTLLLPDESGAGCTSINAYLAIPKGAENKLNAWRFLKILLSEDIQSDRDGPMRGKQPVRISAARIIAESCGYPDPDLDALADAMNRIDRAFIFPPVLWTYLRDNMMPYIKDNKDFDTCFDKLVNVLELYIDE